MCSSDLALTQGNTTAISKGLAPGDIVVTDGQDKLQTGSRIEPRNTGPGTPGGSIHNGNKGAAAGTPGS